jgi:hypothetical protein
MNYDIKVLGKHTYDSANPALQLYLRYIAPFQYGPLHPYKLDEKSINNGTSFFIKGIESFAVTCAHCLDGFFERRSMEPNIFLKIGDFIVTDVESRIIDKDDELDLCSIRMTDNDLSRVGSNKNFLYFMKAPKLETGATVCVIGFPGKLLKPISENQLQAGVFCLFEVIREGNIGKGSFIIEFQKDQWKMALNQSGIELDNFNDFGGISGCPVFFQGELMPLLAGIVFEANPYQMENDSVWRVVVRANFNSFDENGKILRGTYN